MGLLPGHELATKLLNPHSPVSLEGGRRMERLNPELTHGAYCGPSFGTSSPRGPAIWAGRAVTVTGLPMGAWILDHVAAWGGESGRITDAFE